MQTELKRNQGDWLRRAIDELLAERQQMLVSFCRVAGLDPYRQNSGRDRLLQQFCQILIDYLALWHFEIQNHLGDDPQRFRAALAEAARLQDVILDGSETAVEFNDKYDTSTHQLDFSELERDLTRLGERMAVRIEAEDRVIGALPAD